MKLNDARHVLEYLDNPSYVRGFFTLPSADEWAHWHKMDPRGLLRCVQRRLGRDPLPGSIGDRMRQAERKCGNLWYHYQCHYNINFSRDYYFLKPEADISDKPARIRQLLEDLREVVEKGHITCFLDWQEIFSTAFLDKESIPKIMRDIEVFLQTIN